MPSHSNATRQSPFASIVALFLFCVCLFGFAISAQANDEISAENGSTPKLKIGDALPDFSLSDFRGKAFSSEQANNKPLVVFFFGVECPLVKLYVPRMKEIAKKFPDANIEWVGIDSNQHDSLKEIEHFSQETKVPCPLLKDPGNKVADLFGATRTPQVFLFDADHQLRYLGAIDDQYSYGKQKSNFENHYLADAISAMVIGEKPPVEQTEVVGCIIGRVKQTDETSEVTYSNQISRILQRRCVVCHREGEVAPFTLTDYDEVVGWAEMIGEVVDDRRMPPWHANPEHGDFKNDASLSTEEVGQIHQWVAAGAPRGNPSGLPEPATFAEGWQIGQPDVVIAMSDVPYKVPATGVVPYEHFVVDPGFKEDKWVQAAECHIGNRKVVHHIVVALHDEGQKPVHGQVRSEWLTATAPGSPPLILPAGYAKLIPAGSKLLFQMHYTPNGTAQTDISSVGFKFADPATVKKSVGTREISNHDFRIPPGVENHEVEASFKFREDAMILSLFPHMHWRGKSFRYIASYPDGKTEILLDVPNYDFNWQNAYELRQPKLMPAGTVIQCVAHFDNSDKNLANPNPKKAVRWGDQTWDEMMIGYFNMVPADQDLTATPTSK